jgi:ADP-ribose pyrophosphatase YjhB (NUDIX family)
VLPLRKIPLELQAAFTRGIGERLDSTVIGETRTIKGYGVDASSLGTVGDSPANDTRSVTVAGFAAFFAQRLLDGRRARNGARAVGRDDLCVYMLRRTVYGQTVRAEVAHVHAASTGAAQSRNRFLVHGVMNLLLAANETSR